MVKGKITKIVIYSAIVIVIIFLFISITRDFTAHVLLSEYKNSLKKKKQNTERQDWFLKTSLRFSQSNAEPYYRLGKLCVDENLIGRSSEEMVKSYALSQKYFQEALIRKPTDGRNRAVYAWYTGNSGNTREAMMHFNTAIDLGQTDAWPHMLYAMWCVNQVKQEINITDTVKFIEQYRNKQKKEALTSYDGRSMNGVTITTLLRNGKLEWDKALSLGAFSIQALYENQADMNLLELELDKAIHNYRRANNMLYYQGEL